MLVPALLAAQTAGQENDESDWRNDRFWLTVQGNFIRQQQPSFPAAYSGPNSLSPYKEHATSAIETLYTGIRFTKNLELLFDLESAGGAGLSDALGLAGFTNVDVVRNPTLGVAPYVSRVMLHYTLPLSTETVETVRNPLSLASRVPVRRLEFRLGKMSTVDFFDLNSVGSDSHLQFMNWALVNNGAYDYAADTRGYTYGLLIEYYDKWRAVRYQPDADAHRCQWPQSRLEYRAGWGPELRNDSVHPELLKQRQTAVRALVYANRANMGNYDDAINQPIPQRDSHNSRDHSFPAAGPHQVWFRPQRGTGADGCACCVYGEAQVE